jgi:pimeloyl-ACP methyl ester carboxylesterase
MLFLASELFSQVAPTNSPYYNFGPYTVVSDSDITTNPTIHSYRPDNLSGGPFPVFIFQLGANGFFSTSINNHTYDIFLKHLASWGYVVIIVNDAQAGLPSGTSFTTVHNWYKTKVLDNMHWMSSFADPSNVIVGGHSNGGVNATALLINRPNEIQGIVYFASYPSSPFPNHDVSNYLGKVLSLAGSEDGTSTPTACRNGYDKYISSTCKVWGLISGLDHGGFGDYINSNQPVGSIGRTDATATIRHYLLSFMESNFKNDLNANNQLHNSANQPNTTMEFVSNCFVTNLQERFDTQETLIFPNPFRDKIYINGFSEISDKVEISIFDSFGRMVLSKVIYNKLENEINTKNLSKGIYSIVINQGIEITKKTLIKY